ncbi:unnamed protein product [Durusdinium trenchii]|uniref:Uncharacterized protein n=1 Tax=Durusdinium trenchii TaxID=1381693 RepID=A0ABP0STV1_9DINO
MPLKKAAKKPWQVIAVKMKRFAKRPEQWKLVGGCRSRSLDLLRGPGTSCCTAFVFENMLPLFADCRAQSSSHLADIKMAGVVPAGVKNQFVAWKSATTWIL